MRLGWRLPTHGSEQLGFSSAVDLVRYATAVEQAGLDSVWVSDHLLSAQGRYQVQWLDSLMVLGMLAGLTNRITLGTAVLVVPLREPVALAKQVATLHHLSGGRLVLGVGVGHAPEEFVAVGVDRRERGALTDEVLNSIRLMVQGTAPEVGAGLDAFRARVAVLPSVSSGLNVWAAGDLSPASGDGAGVSRAMQRMMRRVTNASGWIRRGKGGTAASVRDDVKAVKDALARAGRRDDGFEFGAIEWVHLSTQSSRAAVEEEQMSAYRSVMDPSRTDSDLRSSYFFGSGDVLVERIAAICDAGVTHLIVSPAVAGAGQFAMFRDRVLPKLVSAGIVEGAG